MQLESKFIVNYVDKTSTLFSQVCNSKSDTRCATPYFVYMWHADHFLFGLLQGWINYVRAKCTFRGKWVTSIKTS